MTSRHALLLTLTAPLLWVLAGCPGPVVVDDDGGVDAGRDSGVIESSDTGLDVGESDAPTDANQADSGADAGFVPPPGCMAPLARCGGAECTVILDSDPLNCGACDRRCPSGVAHLVTSFCDEGVCRAQSCELGFVDVDGDLDNGCEVSDDFALATTGEPIRLVRGTSNAVPVTLTRTVVGSTDPIALGLVSPPVGILDTPTEARGASTLLEVTVDPSAALGPSTLTLRGVGLSGLRSHELSVSVEVVVGGSATISSATVTTGAGVVASREVRQREGAIVVRLRGTNLEGVTSGSFQGPSGALVTATLVGTGSEGGGVSYVDLESTVGLELGIVSARVEGSTGTAGFFRAYEVTPIRLATTGVDTARGTRSLPIATMARALELAAGGATIEVESGTFDLGTHGVVNPAVRIVGIGTTGPSTLRCSTLTDTGLTGDQFDLVDLQIRDCQDAVSFTSDLSSSLDGLDIVATRHGVVGNATYLSVRDSAVQAALPIVDLSGRVEVIASLLVATGTTTLRAARASVSRSTARVEGHVGSAPAIDVTDLEIGDTTVSGSHRPGVSPSGSFLGFSSSLGSLTASDTTWSGFVTGILVSGGTVRIAGGSVVGCDNDVRVSGGMVTISSMTLRESSTTGLYVEGGVVDVASTRFVDHAFTSLSVTAGTVTLRDVVLEGSAVRGQYGIAIGGPEASLTIDESRIERMVTGLLIDTHHHLDVGHLRILDSTGQAIFLLSDGADPMRLGRSDTERIEMTTFQKGIYDWRGPGSDVQAWVDFEGRRYMDRYTATSVLRLPERDTPPWDLFLQGSGHAVVLH
ncbi:MAG: hypothetical protein U0353_29780 [Sandaracinus sp.]